MFSREQAVLRFKNLVNQHWRYASADDTTFSEADKEVVRANIYETIVHQRVPAIRGHLCEAVNYISARDFPERWGALLPQVASGFQGGDLNRTHASVCVLYQLFKRYRHKSDERKEEVNGLVAQIFPVLLQMFQHFAPADTVESIEMCRMVAKCFRVVNEFHLPPCLQPPAAIGPWMAAFIGFMAKPEPAELAQRDADERPLHPHWRCLKTISKVLHRITERYGQPEYAPDGGDDAASVAENKALKKFATAFARDQAPLLQNAFIGVLEAQAAGAFVAPRVLNSTFQFLNISMTQALLFKSLKKKLDFVLFHAVFGCLALKEADVRLWHEDPQEYVNRETDVTTEFHDPRVAATNLLIDLVRKRTAQTLDRVLNHVGQMLAAYSQGAAASAGAAVAPALIVQKDVALRAVGSLSELLVKKAEHLGSLEQLLVAQVVPDLQHASGFLRARACWTLNRFSNFAYSDSAVYAAVVQGVYANLAHAELPVKMEACAAIAGIIRSSRDVEPFRPLIPGILDAFFRLIDEIGNEDVVSIFDSLIEKFGDEISPYAVQLVQRMMQIFMTLVHADVDDDEAICTAMSCVRAVNTVLHSIAALPHLYAPLEEACAPAIHAVLSTQTMDFFDDVLELVPRIPAFRVIACGRMA